MKALNTFKKTLGFLTAAMTVAAMTVGCSEKIEPSEADLSSVSESSDTDDTDVTAQQLSTKTEKVPKKDIFSKRDLDPGYDEVTAEITLGGDSAAIDGSGAAAEGSVITITEEGVYLISGNLDDGQIIVNADKAKVQLVLDNADITCKTSSPIYGADSDKIFITLAEGSSNVLTDGSSYTYDDEAADEPDACIFSKDSLTINGSGSLSVNGNYGDGIRSKDDIIITGGNISVTAVNHGIKGKDYVGIADGNITVSAGQDGIKSTNADDAALGFVYIEDGKFSITSGNDGIQAETDLIIAGGEFNITAGGGSAASTKVHTDGFGGMGGGFGGGKGGFRGGFGDFDPESFDFEGMTPPDGFGGGQPPFGSEPPFGNTTAEQVSFVQTVAATDETESSDSSKGIKGGASIDISGGNITVNSADDAVHSNGDVYISGGSLTLESGDDGIHADSVFEMSDGAVNITKSYEGIEAATISVKGGSVELVAADDGFNASDGTPQGGMGQFASGVSLEISGGYVYVNADGDGLDSNGSLNISGGTIIVDGPANGGNGALDSNGEIVVTGGLLVAAGSSQMAEAPGSSSTQNSVSATFNSTFEAGTAVALLGEDGEEIVCFKSAKSFNNIVISSPDIESGKTYTFYTDGTFSGESEVSRLYKGYKNDGSEAGSFTSDSVISYIGQQSGMGGGFGGRGFGGKDMQIPSDANGQMTPPDGGFGGRGGRRQNSSVN